MAADAHKRGDLAGIALAAQHVSDGEVLDALEEAVLAHPAVGVDLRQVRAAAVRNHADHERPRIVNLLCNLDGRLEPQAPRATGEDALRSGKASGGQEGVT